MVEKKKKEEKSTQSGEITQSVNYPEVVKEIDLKGMQFTIVKAGDGFTAKRGAEVIGENLPSVDEAGNFIHKFCYGAKTV